MILTLLYHRTLGMARSVTPIEILEAQFSYISSRFETVFPGDPVSNQLQICLTFDDGYADFYYTIFPLLKKYKLKAVVAPITSYIPETVTLSEQERLSALALFESPQKGGWHKDLYCSWDELDEMQNSSLIQVACHSHTHPKRITKNSFEAEVVYSKKNLEERLKKEVTTFIFPYGMMDSTLYHHFQAHFSYLFRIGGAMNWHWNQKDHLYYRVSCDEISHYLDPFKGTSLLKFATKKCLNALLSR